MQAKVATAGDASEEQSEKLAELVKEHDAIQTALDEATAQVRANTRERESFASLTLRRFPATSNHFGGQGTQAAEAVERLTASLADEQVPLLPRDPKPEASPKTDLPASSLV